MLDIKCDRCGDELKEPGGLLFGAPNPLDQRVQGYPTMVAKWHLCHICYRAALTWMVKGQ